MRVTAKTVQTLIDLAEKVSHGAATTATGAGYDGEGERWTSTLAQRVWLSAKKENRAAAAYQLGIIKAYTGAVPSEWADLLGHLALAPLPVQRALEAGEMDARAKINSTVRTTLRMSPRLLPEHVRELATLFGSNVAVPMPHEHNDDTGPLWVISVENKHYEGAGTVRATSDEVAALAHEEDFDEDGDLTEHAVNRILLALWKRPRAKAIESAKQMDRPEGYSAWVHNQTAA